MQEYFKALPDGPYRYLSAPRTGLGVGTILTTWAGTTLVAFRPETCFPAPVLGQVATQTHKLTLPELQSTSSYQWDIGLRVAEAGPITEAVRSEFKRKNVQTLVLKLGPLTRTFLSVDELRRAIRSQVDTACRESLSGGKPQHRLILETLSTDTMSVEFRDEANSSASLAAAILALLFPSARSEGASDVASKLEFSGIHHIVAVKEIRLRDVEKFSTEGTEWEVVVPEEQLRWPRCPTLHGSPQRGTSHVTSRSSCSSRA